MKGSIFAPAIPHRLLTLPRKTLHERPVCRLLKSEPDNNLFIFCYPALI